MRISCCYCICWVSISWERPDLDFNNSRLFSDTWEDYIGPVFDSRYPAYQNMFGQNILWYLLCVMRCDKFIRSTSRISFVTTHIKNKVREPDDWLKEVSSEREAYMVESMGPPMHWGKRKATKTMVESMGPTWCCACGTHERERERERGGGAYMPPLIMLPDGSTHDQHYWVGPIWDTPLGLRVLCFYMCSCSQFCCFSFNI